MGVRGMQPSLLSVALLVVAPFAAAAAAGQTSDLLPSYLDLVDRYRAGEETQQTLALWPLENIRTVVRELGSQVEPCSRDLCLEAAALLHTEAAAALLARVWVVEADAHLSAARIWRNLPRESRPFGAPGCSRWGTTCWRVSTLRRPCAISRTASSSFQKQQTCCSPPARYGSSGDRSRASSP